MVIEESAAAGNEVGSRVKLRYSHVIQRGEVPLEQRGYGKHLNLLRMHVNLLFLCLLNVE